MPVKALPPQGSASANFATRMSSGTDRLMWFLDGLSVLRAFMARTERRDRQESLPNDGAGGSFGRMPGGSQLALTEARYPEQPEIANGNRRSMRPPGSTPFFLRRMP